MASSRVTHRSRVSRGICHLPPEVLSMIFLEVQTTENALEVPELNEAPHRTPWQESMGAPAWTDVLFVCRLWHEVALGCSSLWTQMVNPSVEWAEECLSRSAAIPLVLNSTRQWMKKIKLSVIAPDAYMYTKLIDILTSEPAPLLEYLSLWQLAPDSHEVHGDFQLDPLFSGHTPSLRRLRIDMPSCYFALHSPMFLSLTYLMMKLGSRYGSENLLVALENWKQLQTLILWYSLPSHDTDSASPDYELLVPANRIELPNLQQLRLCDTSSRLQSFLSHTLIPTSALLHLNSVIAPIPGNPQEEQSNLASATTDMLSSIPLDITETIKAVYLCPSSVDSQLCMTALSEDELRAENGEVLVPDKGLDPDEDNRVMVDDAFYAKLLLQLQNDEAHDMSHPSCFEAIFKGLRFSGLRSMRLDGCHTYSTHTWIEVFKTINNLLDLEMCFKENDTANEVIKALGTEISTNGDDHLILPKLTKLLVQHPVNFPRSTREHLATMLAIRHRYSGLKLHKLNMVNKKEFDEAILAELSSHVDNAL
ncbi:hypothetical protein EVG20_g8500 [Dentipellis fragilis]|uniref:Uncharacterized protein n=1 Tax=Dentipellis fragilis TaxID=205917 RepID=A0A4Y9Y685_9AGAM|nr:hypothetical protein EVG20_g8500 [Dentipellis fragilis]